MSHSVSLVVIARDEAPSIRRCLASVAGLVDELLVLDTGSSDDTVEIARAAGARVERFDWVDDFAAARNRSLELAGGAWRLVLDADEWLTAGEDDLRALRASRPDWVGALAQDNVSGEGLRTTAWLPRILPRGVAYEGRIHEQPVFAGAARRTGVRVGHDGYLAGRLERKSERNRPLLEAALADRPEDAYLRYQLGKDHEVGQRYQQAVVHYDLAWAATSPQAPWRHDLVVRYLFALARAGRTLEALAVADRELPRWPHSADVSFVVADVLLAHATAHPEQAAGLLPLIEARWERCLEIGDSDLPGSVEGRGSHLAAHNLAVPRG